MPPPQGTSRPYYEILNNPLIRPFFWGRDISLWGWWHWGGDSEIPMITAGPRLAVPIEVCCNPSPLSYNDI